MSDSPRWFPPARCHFMRIHESHWEKGELYRCKWCEKMLERFHILGLSPDNPEHYFARDKYTGHLWKLKGRENLSDARFDIHKTFKGRL